MYRDDSAERLPRRAWWSAVIAPIIVLLLVIGIVSVLVLTGLVQGDAVRLAPEGLPTTVPTIEIAP